MKLLKLEYFNYYNLFTQFLLVCLLVLISGCDTSGIDKDDTNTKNETGIAVPLAIQTKILPPNGKLLAYIQIDSGERQMMNVENNQASLSLSELSLGEHQLTITFEFILANTDALVLATAVKTLEVVDGINALSYTNNDYTFPDDDGDGISNLVEISNIVPVANAGPDQFAAYNDIITLDASGSSDANGDSMSYQWSFVETPAGSSVSLSDPNTIMPTFTVDVPDIGAVYIMQLIVSDGLTESEPDTVTVSTGNIAPVANAGPDQFVTFKDIVTLDGTGSTDVNGDSLTYYWAFVSKPVGSAAIISDPNSPMPTFTVDTNEVGVSYTIGLVVNDGSADSEPSLVIINTGNVAPVANAGPDQVAIYNAVVTLDGSNSSDLNGDNLTYSWSFISKPTRSIASLSSASAITTSFIVDVIEVGVKYVIQLKINDGTTSSLADTVTISTDNIAPIANAGPDQAAAINTNVTLDGNSSSDVNGDGLIYKWSLTSKPTGSTASISNPNSVMPSFMVDVTGNGVSYIAQLIVNDGRIDSPPDTVTINTLNTRPVASAGANLTRVIRDAVTLNGASSNDADGDTLSYSWSLVSQPPSSAIALSNRTTVTPSFVPNRVGTYQAQLIVNDGTINSATDSTLIRVKSRSFQWNSANNLLGWTPNTAFNTNTVVTTGGFPTGYMSSTADTSVYTGAVYRGPELTGDLRGNRWKISVSLKFLSGTFNSAKMRFRYLNSTRNGWNRIITNSYVNSWSTYSTIIDPNWTDAQASAKGWVQEATSGTWRQTMASMYTMEVRVTGSTGSVLGIDNFVLEDAP